MDKYNLQRFLDAQEGLYSTALHEIKEGCKRSHRIWYISPQMKGLGQSANCNFYGINCMEEAEEYLKNDTLKARFVEISTALLNVEGKTALQILGSVDARNVQSCMTLFDSVAPNGVFAGVWDKYYCGDRDKITLQLLNV